ncbi:MAG: 6-carboxytetrahydropterin synthase [Candidatus Latescibacterota bacterium]|nr:6-carboxytetrahydropterin synthase [Candidatus Latescibacterota bacterium]
MEQIVAKGRFHAAHRQLGYDGKCAWVHGHTWRGAFTVCAKSFPRDELDMSVDFGTLKDIFKELDHRMLVSEQDTTFLDAGLFEPEGVVVMPGNNPSVENVTHYCMNEAVDRLAKLFPGHGIDYDLELTIQETDNNFFTLRRTVTI